ncbi:NAD(P)/FAD-dependent oxidoreductase [Ideonella sp. A 288]|uniref:flavin monoamine oxidase family protein n=1 Tax=Ideonella sp. A 288 TaxID=1962181 RepID=UPI001F24F0F1|nr:NAD(P)/FAD-dependent oxidoreductase [Ideonella sp. A 288]
MTAPLRRRALLGASAGAAFGILGAGCRDAPPAGWSAHWVGSSPLRGHRLREARSGTLPTAAVQRRARVLIVGAGIAGLSAARACLRQGVDDIRVLELEDSAGGNSRGHTLAGLACPLGAHYLPLPGPAAHEVAEWLHELGLLRHELGRTVADERHLCHSPQERLFIDGAWIEGLLPPAEAGSATLAQYRTFAAAIAQAQRSVGFALPSHRAGWTAAHQALDAGTFAHWLDARGLRDERLRWYLDYACLDDYGAPADTVSAWAGLHYFASRHGFQAPGDADGERDPVFTWPEGNAWLATRLAAPLGDRLLPGRTVLQVDEGRHGVHVLAWDEAAGHAEAWQADTVVLAVPLFVAARLMRQVPAALEALVPAQPHAPWLVANLHVTEPLLQRQGMPPAWDNVVYGRHELGYVDAMHQSLRPVPGPTVLTAYHAMTASDRPALLAGEAADWARRVVDGLTPLHPDLPGKLARVDLTRHGHAMSIPVPGLRGHPALAALRAGRGRVRFAHADLAGYSVFEEAFTLGAEVAGFGSSTTPRPWPAASSSRRG